MTDTKKKMFAETVENLKHLDRNSLLIVKSGTELLKARSLLDKKTRTKITGDKEAHIEN